MPSIGSYELHSVLGRGALATVYRATRERDEVALKVIRKDFLASSEHEDLLARFHREADICRRLRHPNIVQVLDAGETDELAWLAMELVDGRELKSAASARLSLEDRVGLFLQLLAALDYAHAQGVVHRDIKPANAMVTAGQHLKLTDFGIARLAVSDLTLAGAILGTPSYMPPEQVLGQAIDGRADVYAAGATLFYLLTERKPYSGSLAEILQAVLHRPVAPPSTVSAAAPTAFDAVVARATAKRPHERYATAAEFAAAVRLALDDALRDREDKAGDATMVCGGGATVMMSVDAQADSNDPQHLSLRLHRLLGDVAGKAMTSERQSDIRACGDRLLDLIEADASEPAAGLRAGLIGVSEPVAAQLRALIREHAPLPGANATVSRRNDWLEMVELLAHLHGWMKRLGSPERTAPTVYGVGDDLSVAVMRYVSEVHGLVFSPDHVEVNRVTANLLRVDILEWGLELLSADRLVRELRIAKRMIACEVMRKVAASIRELTTSADDLARFDVANMLMEIEELVALATRVVEDDPEGGHGTYANTMGRDVLGDFIVSSRGLVSFSREELLRQCVEGPRGASVFAANLRQLGRLGRFSMRLDEPSCGEVLKALTADVHSVVHDVAAQLERALPDHRTQPWLHHNLTAAHEVAEELGLLQVARSLLAHVRDGMRLAAG